ncbi:glycosyltransferase [Microbacterium luticocti]|uniref:glycosyltransferase n=1 Tax=Microbacterium luticocti TaxID=451764 RepID=UPI00042683EF|nr:glycosyltransferase [Microbacterium luticocti]
MPARVHAILVVRPDARIPAAHRLERLLQALAAQTRTVAALTIVLCGDDADAAAFAAASGAEAVLTASRTTGFAAAVQLAARRIDGGAVWLLAHDTVPEPDALEHLTDALEIAPSVGIVAPKLVRWNDRQHIVSLGVSMTRYGRSVGLADDEYDQGQHDATEDVLGADVRGILVRTEVWNELHGLDPALAGADEGLDLGVRTRLAGGRVVVVPAARVAVHGDGVAGLPGLPVERTFRTWYMRRRAQLQRRLAYAHPVALPLLWLALLPVALWRTVVQLVAKTPGRVLPEWGAAFAALVGLGAVARARRRIRAVRRVAWSQLAPLRVSREQLRTGLHPDPDVHDDHARRGDLRFFSGGGAWAVLGALLVAIAMFPALLAWPALGGGALAPLRATVGRLWADAAFGLRPEGLDQIGPADPFSGLIALIGTLWPFEPSRALVVLWLLALPLAVLGAWFAATRLTDRSVLRITAAVAWALAPTFLAALTQGRPTGVLVHLLLPWLLYAGSVAHRSWGAAASASLLLAAVTACAPSLGPALVLLWLIVLVVMLTVRRGRGAARVAWTLVPTLVLFAPVAFAQLRAQNLWGLLADPGVPWAGPQVAADAAGRALLAAGSPTTDPGGWGALLHAGTFGAWAATLSPAWMLVLLAPLGLLAITAVFTRRWLAGAVLLLVAVLGIATACAAAGIAVSFTDGAAVPLWPGTALSLAWAGAVGAAVLTLDTGFALYASPDADRAIAAGRPRVLAATVVMLALAVFALPALTAHLRDEARLTDGPASTLPAFVTAEGRSDPNTGTVVLRPLADGGVQAQVVWGESATLGGQSTVLDTATGVDARARELAALAADLVSPTSSDVVARLQAQGIAFVLLAPADEHADRARALHATAETAMSQRKGLGAVGQTDKGTLWRVTSGVKPRAEASVAVTSLGHGITAAQLIAVAVALLLAVPTAASRRRARHTPRVVGRREAVPVPVHVETGPSAAADAALVGEGDES